VKRDGGGRISCRTPIPSGKKLNAGCIRCAEALSELETDDYHRPEVLIMVEDTLARTGYA
jgi:hypothetical protein